MTISVASYGMLVYAPVSIVWDQIHQIERWQTWHPTIKKIELLETPKIDAIGQMMTKRGKRHSFKIIAIGAQEVFDWQRPFILNTFLIYRYRLNKKAEDTLFTIDVDCHGRLKAAAQLLCRSRILAQLQEEVLTLKRQCEGQAKGNPQSMTFTRVA